MAIVGGPPPPPTPLLPIPALPQAADAQRQLAAEQVRNRRPKYTIAAYIGASPAALEVKR